MSYQYLTYTVKNRVGYITLNRPEKRNALNARLVGELSAAFARAEQDDNVKIIVLNAKGKAFSAGADLGYIKSLQKNSYAENLADSQGLMRVFRQIYELDKIVIAQVEGHAIAGGCGLATICDFVFAIPEALFGYSEVKIGFIPAIVMVFLLRKIGETQTKELLLTGRLISATQAQQIGLINFVASIDNIEQTVYDFAQKLCIKTSADSLRMTKQMIAHVQSLSLEDALQYAAEMNAKARATADCQRGISAFLSKEKIVW